jgi:uridine kinase
LEKLTEPIWNFSQKAEVSILILKIIMWLIIGVSGVTCSGKSTLAWSLHKELSGSSLICQDDFFLPADSEQHTLVPGLNHFNWDILSSLDMEQMHTVIENLLSDSARSVLSFSKLVEVVKSVTGSCLYAESETDKVGTFLNFTDGRCRELPEDTDVSKPNQTQSVVTDETIMASTSEVNVITGYDDKQASCLSVLIIEGFLIFNDKKIADLCHRKYFLTLPREECWARRSLKTYDPPDVPGYFDQCVWPEYEKHRDEVYRDVPDVILIDGNRDKTSIMKQVLLEVVQAAHDLLQS